MRAGRRSLDNTQSKKTETAPLLSFSGFVSHGKPLLMLKRSPLPLSGVRALFPGAVGC